MATPAPTLETHMPAEVIDFCAERQLLPHLERPIRLAERHFSPVQGMRREVETDPETDEQCVLIDVMVRMDPEEVLRRDSAYIREWVESTPPDVRPFIRVLYQMVQASGPTR